MSAGHTPGPWAIERDGGYDLTGVEADIAEMQECEPYALTTLRIVAPGKSTGSFRRNPETKAFDVPVPFEIAERVHDPRFGDPAEHEANARLIAAAPDLLEALQGVLPRNLCLTNSNVRDDTVVPLETTMGELRKIAAAIARATGAA